MLLYLDDDEVDRIELWAREALTSPRSEREYQDAENILDTIQKERDE